FIRKYKGELYAPPVAWLLQVIVRSIQAIQTFRYRFLPPTKKTRKTTHYNHYALLSPDQRLHEAVSAHFAPQKVDRISETGHGDDPFYLRYTPAYAVHHPDT